MVMPPAFITLARHDESYPDLLQILYWSTCCAAVSREYRCNSPSGPLDEQDKPEDHFS